MTRKSKREIENALEDIEGGDPVSRAESWRAFLRGERTLEDHREAGGGR